MMPGALKSCVHPPGVAYRTNDGIKFASIPLTFQEYEAEQKIRAKSTAIVFRALCDYQSEDVTDLSFQCNNLILVVDQGASKDAWWEGVMDGKFGCFPGTYVTKMAFQPPNTNEFWFPLGLKPEDHELAKAQV